MPRGLLPRDVWYVHAAMGLENGQRRLARNSFRAFVHAIDLIESIMARAGLRLGSPGCGPLTSTFGRELVAR
jgi:hypothetical protein